MTSEDKKLLLKDLCARLPYHPNIRIFNPDGFEGYQTGEFDTSLWPHHIEPFQMDRFEIIKPYLRPMSSMTEEEADEWAKASNMKFDMEDGFFDLYDAHLSVDWLNAHHFDYRDLIEKGLALEAPDGMYKTE